MEKELEGPHEKEFCCRSCSRGTVYVSSALILLIFGPIGLYFVHENLSPHLDNYYSESGEPMFLTSLIESGRISEARKKARVNAGLFLERDSFSGFLTVNKSNHMHFVFFPSASATNAPLIVCIGDPDVPSILEMFGGSGPYQLRDMNLQHRQSALAERLSLLYIDVPGTGYSFEEAEEDSATSLVQGLVFFNPWLAPEEQINFGDRLHKFGIIEEKNLAIVRREESYIKNLLRFERWEEAYHEYHERYTKSLFTFFIGRETCSVESMFSNEIAFLNQTWVRRALHVGSSFYNVFSAKVKTRLRGEWMQSSLPFLEEILQVYRVMLIEDMLGVFDETGPSVGTQAVSRALRWPGAVEFQAARRGPWLVQDRVLGYVKTGGNLTETIVRPLDVYDVVYEFSQGLPTILGCS